MWHLRPAASGRRGAGLARHIWETVKLAVPVMIGRSGTLIMITADVIMTGRAGARELAYYGLAYGATQVLVVIGLGAMTGTTVLASQADGMGDAKQCGAVWKVGLAHALAMGVVFAALCVLGERFLLLTGQSAELARNAGRAMLMTALGLPPMLMYLATALFLEGIRRPQPNMWLMLAANLINIALNWLLIYGHTVAGLGSVGGMGAEGAALATALTRWLMFLALAAYVLTMADGGRFGMRERARHPMELGRKLRRIGVPLGLAQGLESSAFTALVLMAGLLGSAQLAVYQIALNLLSVVYMLAMGVGAATSVRVGHAVGRADPRGLSWAGWVGAGIAMAMLSCICAVFQVIPGVLAGIYTGDGTLLALAIPVLTIAGLFIVVDGGQGVMVGALRGVGDVWVPSGMVVAGFWGVTVPLGHHLAFARQMGVAGLLWGLFAGALLAVVMLLGRFYWITHREIKPL